MLNKRLIALSGVTLVSALAIGFTMQRGAAVESDTTPMTLAAEPELQLQDITLTSKAPSTDLTLEEPDSRLSAIPEPVAGDCAISVSATLAPLALVDLAFVAPCHGNERVTVHHSGFMFTATTESDGSLSVQVPAMVENAVFIVELASGPGVVATTQVSGLDQIDRVALQWTGNSGLEIHAREFGAEYGQAGHVWSGAGGAERASQVLRLGDDNQLAPRIVEVYSFNRNAVEEDGTVALSIEAEISGINCGREISAQTLELRAGQGLQTRDLVLSMPNCNAIGDFLVLNNLVEDLKIAAK